MVITFSVAKPFAALALVDDVAQGHLDLDQQVVSVSLAFGQTGKSDTTMRNLLSHQAGLSAFPVRALRVAYDDRKALVDLLAAAPLGPSAGFRGGRARSDLWSPARRVAVPTHRRTPGRAVCPRRECCRVGTPKRRRMRRRRLVNHVVTSPQQETSRPSQRPVAGLEAPAPCRPAGTIPVRP